MSSRLCFKGFFQKGTCNHLRNGDFLDLFTLNIYSIFLVQEIFERYSREIEYIFDFSSSREIRERFRKDPGEIEYIFNFSSSREIQERFERDSRDIRERSRKV